MSGVSSNQVYAGKSSDSKYYLQKSVILYNSITTSIPADITTTIQWSPQIVQQENIVELDELSTRFVALHSAIYSFTFTVNFDVTDNIDIEPFIRIFKQEGLQTLSPLNITSSLSRLVAKGTDAGSNSRLISITVIVYLYLGDSVYMTIQNEVTSEPLTLGYLSTLVVAF